MHQPFDHQDLAELSLGLNILRLLIGTGHVLRKFRTRDATRNSPPENPTASSPPR